MSLFSLIAVLLLEQYRSLEIRNQLLLAFTRYANYVEHNLNAGEKSHGVIAWLFAVVPIIFVTGVIYFLLYRITPVLAWLWNVAVLYLTMGFRQFSHAFTQISVALEAGEIQTARNILAKWRGKSAAEYTSNEVAKLAIEQGLTNSHLHVFGTMMWFLILPGPTGALLYRAGSVLAQKWGGNPNQEFNHFGKFAEQVFYWLDWLPQRLTAITFAVVGDFQGAMDCWRMQAKSWTEQHGIILASGAGALGIRLGDPIREIGGGVHYRPTLGTGDEVDADYMQSTIGLIWRALVLWLVLILMFSVATWVSYI